MKKCSKCRVGKDRAEFSLCAASHDGLQNYCKSCARSEHPCQSDPEKHRAQSLRSYHRAAQKPGFRATVRVSNRNSKRKRRHRDPIYRSLMNLRSRMRLALRGGHKSAATFKLVGCPKVWLEVHLESQFKPGMTWENYGPVWHVDHIKPCARFNLADPEQQQICFHWTNLQPLFAAENIAKGDTYAG